jgi:hypothetical protein
VTLRQAQGRPTNQNMKLLRKLRALFCKEKLDVEMSEEMRAHLELQTQQNIERGMPPEEARYAARRSFGGVEQIKEQAREQRGLVWLEQAWQDVRFAARVLAKQRAFTFVAVLTLAIGIGASSAIMGVMRARVLDPIPGADESRLLEINERALADGRVSRTSLYVAERVRQLPEVFDKMTVFGSMYAKVTEDGLVQDFRGAEVDAGFFDFFGVRPLLGRWLTAEETQSRSANLIVISYKIWQTRFGGDSGVLGRQIRMRDNWGREALHTVIGVMPPAFRVPAGDCAFWQALRPEPIQLSQPREPNYWVFVRRADDVPAEKAQAALDVLHGAMVQEFDASPMTVIKPSERVLRLRP